jgi:hypothetical protein
MLAACIAIQVIALGVLAFGDVGFDKPGRFGLSFEHGVLCMAAYAGALITGIVVALRRRRWVIAGGQGIVPLLLIAVALWPSPRLSASDYQHLVGQPIQSVERELGVRGRSSTSGFVRDDRGEFEFMSYRGLTVYYGADGIVDRIESRD